MKMKVIALGNVLMGDDGIAISIARMLEPELNRLGLEVLLGETDPYYCITMIREEDFLILMDAGCFGKNPGDITLLPIKDCETVSTVVQHDIRFIDLLKLHIRHWDGVVLAIEIAEVDFRYGISQQLSDKVNLIAEEVITVIKEIYNNG